MPDVNVGTAYGRLKLNDEWTGTLKRIQRDQTDAARRMSVDLERTRAVAARTSTALLAMGAAGTLALGGLAKMAADATESENLFTVALGRNADAVRTWSRGLRKELGLNEYELRKNIGVWNTMLSNMGLGEERALDMSKALVKLAYDMSSFRNIRPEEAFEKLRSGITGEIEPLRRLGIMVDDLTVKTHAYSTGIARQGEELTQSQKLLARYQLIMKQTALDQGDLARTMDSPINQLRVMQSEAAQVAIEFGQQLIPAFAEVIKAGRSLVGVLDGLTDDQKGQLARLALAGLAGSVLLGGLGRIALAITGIVDSVKLLNVALAAGGAARLLTGGGLLAGGMVVVGGAAYLGMQSDLERWRAEREAETNRQWMIDPATGRLRPAPPNWKPPGGAGTTREEALRQHPLPAGITPTTTLGGGGFSPMVAPGLRANQLPLFGLEGMPQAGRGAKPPAPLALTGETRSRIAAIRAGATETLADDLAAARMEESRLWAVVRSTRRPTAGQKTEEYEQALLAAEQATAARRQIERRIADAANEERQRSWREAQRLKAPTYPSRREWERVRNAQTANVLSGWWDFARAAAVDRLSRGAGAIGAAGTGALGILGAGRGLLSEAGDLAAYAGIQTPRDRALTQLQRGYVNAGDLLGRGAGAAGQGLAQLLAGGRAVAGGMDEMGRLYGMGAQLGGVSSALKQSGEAIGRAIRQGAERSARDVEERWERTWGRMGSALFEYGGARGGLMPLARDAASAGLQGRWADTWRTLTKPGGALTQGAAWFNRSWAGRTLSRNKLDAGDVLGAAGGLYSISRGEGGLLGGAMSGASIGSMFPGAGTAIGAVVGGVYALFAGDSAERRQQHREAQRAREAMAEQLKRLSHELRPVSDYFRSAGMQNLPGIGTFGGASLAAQAAGGARL